jgi:hypothetical protein
LTEVTAGTLIPSRCGCQDKHVDINADRDSDADNPAGFFRTVNFQACTGGPVGLFLFPGTRMEAFWGRGLEISCRG